MIARYGYHGFRPARLCLTHTHSSSIYRRSQKLCGKFFSAAGTCLQCLHWLIQVQNRIVNPSTLMLIESALTVSRTRSRRRTCKRYISLLGIGAPWKKPMRHGKMHAEGITNPSPLFLPEGMTAICARVYFPASR